MIARECLKHNIDLFRYDFALVLLNYGLASEVLILTTLELFAALRK